MYCLILKRKVKEMIIFYYQEDHVDIMLNQIRSLQRDKAEEELKEILDKMMAQNIKFDNMWLFLNQIFSALFWNFFGRVQYRNSGYVERTDSPGFSLFMERKQ